MIKVRIQFKRSEELRFLSNLDQQRLFERALRRAQLPLAFSRGFNPHPIMSFANAMSVGMTSDCEFVDIGVEAGEGEVYSPMVFRRKLAEQMPEGIELLDAALIPKNSKSLASLIKSADYEIRCLNIIVNNFDEFNDSLKSFSGQESVLIKKASKKAKKRKRRMPKTEETVDIRQNFSEITAEKDGKDVVFHIRVLPVNGSLISPKVVVKAFLGSIDYYADSLTLETHRKSLNLKGGGVTPIKD